MSGRAVGAAVGHDAVGAGQLRKQRVDLLTEGLLGSIARPVQPPDRPRALLAAEGVEHRQDRGRADAGADQHDRPGPRAQREAPARGGHVDHVTDGGVLVQVAARRALALDADPVAVLAGEI